MRIGINCNYLVRRHLAVVNIGHMNSCMYDVIDMYTHTRTASILVHISSCRALLKAGTERKGINRGTHFKQNAALAF